MRIIREYKSIYIIVGPWAARFAWGHGHFGWREGDGWVTRHVRKWWTGWHRWGEDDEW